MSRRPSLKAHVQASEMENFLCFHPSGFEVPGLGDEELEVTTYTLCGLTHEMYGQCQLMMQLSPQGCSSSCRCSSTPLILQ